MFPILEELEKEEQHVEGKCENILRRENSCSIRLTMQLIVMEVGQLYGLPPFSCPSQWLQYTFLMFSPLVLLDFSPSPLVSGWPFFFFFFYNLLCYIYYIISSTRSINYMKI